ncbi:TRAP transporter small permease [Desulfogranum mediterraneum]|uniref:TRAP transporter small permease n=1 Tax=Desulfogranum mediterraneum TaxID=160661 RepID=UPI0004220DE9|nr:TRAP transporter small permease [Desulfogranum mediterraneum]
MLHTLQSGCRRLNTWIEYLLASLGMTMALVVIAQVFCRYVLNSSLFWSEELARYLLVWLSFLGATTAYYRGAHPGVDLVSRRLPAAGRWFCRLLTHLISLALFGIIILAGVQFAYFIRLQISPALGLPKWIVLAVIPISGIILLAHGAAFLLETILEPDHDQ